MGLSAVQELARILKGMRAKGVRSVWLSEWNRRAFTARPGQYSAAAEKVAPAASGIAAAPAVNKMPSRSSEEPARILSRAGGQSGSAVFSGRASAVDKMPPPPPPIPQAMPSVVKVAANPVPDGFVSSISGMGCEELEHAMGSCSCCPCFGKRGKSVYYAGESRPKVMFIGDYPSEDECAGVSPFASPSGQMLYKMAVAMGLSWSEAPAGKGAALVNVLKCRPDGINPPAAALEVCGACVRRQIELASPDALVLLGPLPLKVLAASVKDSFSRIEGKVIKCGGIPAVAIKHPSMIMRFAAHQDVFINERRLAWNGLQELMKIIF